MLLLNRKPCFALKNIPLGHLKGMMEFFASNILGHPPASLIIHVLGFRFCQPPSPSFLYSCEPTTSSDQTSSSALFSLFFLSVLFLLVSDLVLLYPSQCYQIAQIACWRLIYICLISKKISLCKFKEFQ